MRALTPWSIAFAASWMIAGCTSGSGSSGASPEGGSDASGRVTDAGTDASDALDEAVGVDCGALAWASSACASCTSQSCCQLEGLCATIPTCAPLAECWKACAGDAGCDDGCAMQYTQAISNYNAILNCQSNSCASACQP